MKEKKPNKKSILITILDFIKAILVSFFGFLFDFFTKKPTKPNNTNKEEKNYPNKKLEQKKEAKPADFSDYHDEEPNVRKNLHKSTQPDFFNPTEDELKRKILHAFCDELEIEKRDLTLEQKDYIKELNSKMVFPLEQEINNQYISNNEELKVRIKALLKDELEEQIKLEKKLKPSDKKVVIIPIVTNDKPLEKMYSLKKEFQNTILKDEMLEKEQQRNANELDIEEEKKLEEQEKKELENNENDLDLKEQSENNSIEETQNDNTPTFDTELEMNSFNPLESDLDNESDLNYSNDSDSNNSETSISEDNTTDINLEETNKLSVEPILKEEQKESDKEEEKAQEKQEQEKQEEELEQQRQLEEQQKEQEQKELEEEKKKQEEEEEKQAQEKEEQQKQEEELEQQRLLEEQQKEKEQKELEEQKRKQQEQEEEEKRKKIEKDEQEKYDIIDLRTLEKEIEFVSTEHKNETQKENLEDKNYWHVEEHINYLLEKIAKLKTKKLSPDQLKTLLLKEEQVLQLKKSLSSQKKQEIKKEESFLEENIPSRETNALLLEFQKIHLENQLDLNKYNLAQIEDLKYISRDKASQIEKELLKLKLKKAYQAMAVSAFPFINNKYFSSFSKELFANNQLKFFDSILKKETAEYNPEEIEQIKKGSHALQGANRLNNENMEYLNYLERMALTKYPELSYDQEYQLYLKGLRTSFNQNQKKMKKKQDMIEQYELKNDTQIEQQAKSR